MGKRKSEDDLPKKSAAERLSFELQLANLPKVDWKNAEEVRTRVNQFFDICVTSDMVATKSSLAVAFHTNGKKLNDIETGVAKLPEEVQEIIQSAVAIITAATEGNMLENIVPAVPSIFDLKAQHGYKDTPDAPKTIVNLLGNTVDPEELQKKYLGGIIAEKKEE